MKFLIRLKVYTQVMNFMHPLGNSQTFAFFFDRPHCYRVTSVAVATSTKLTHQFQENNNVFQESCLWTNQQLIKRKKSYSKLQFLLLLIANVLKKVKSFISKWFSTRNFTYTTEDTLFVGYKLFIIFVIYLQFFHCHYCDLRSTL